MDEMKENGNDANYIKKNLCPKGLCSHQKNECKKHKVLYCSNYFCDGCLKDIKKPHLKRNIDNEIYIRI